MKRLALLLIFLISIFATAELQAKKNFHKKHKPYSVSATKKTSRPLNNTYQLTQAINQAINSITPRATVGIIIKSMKNGQTLYSRNAKNLFIPASILKVLTAESALLYLGPQYQFSTQFVTTQPIINGVLQGDLYLVHSGDPSLTYLDLADMMTALKLEDVRAINGNVYIDTSAYDQVNTGPGWLWTDRRYCYAAPISASIINHNCLTLQVEPGRYSGQLAQVYTNPSAFYAGIRNGVVTKGYGARGCYVKLNGVSAGVVSLSGCMAKGQDAAGIATVINDIQQYDISLLTSLFKQFHVQVYGNIYAGKAPAHTHVLAAHSSKPLSTLISDMLKMSDNIIAGSVFKKIGQTYHRRAGTWENAGSAVHSILSSKAGVDIWKLNVIDGSGLSRYNQMSPQQMLQLLDFTFHHRKTNYALISALPVSGVDGTLKRRMRNIAWRVRAKTGTLAGVVSLAGYAMNADREPFAFVIIVNSNHGSVWKYREMEDKVLTYLTRFSRR